MRNIMLMLEVYFANFLWWGGESLSFQISINSLSDRGELLAILQTLPISFL